MHPRRLWENPPTFKTHDAFLTPTVFTVAFRHDHTPLNKRQLPTAQGCDPTPTSAFGCRSRSWSGCRPRLHPSAKRKRLPVGIQIVGQCLEDATTIDLDGHLADVLGGFKPPAGFCVDHRFRICSGSGFPVQLQKSQIVHSHQLETSGPGRRYAHWRTP